MVLGRNSPEEKLISLLQKNDQEHLLRFWDELNDAERDLLLEDIRKIDFGLFRRFLDIGKTDIPKERNFELPPVIEIPKTTGQKKREKAAFDAGCDCIAGSKLAVFTAAGGQSSRLGLDYPKGAFPVTPVRKKTLFQVLAEKICYMKNRFGVEIPWVIMVSETNREQTRSFFDANRFFGLKSGLVRFVEQGTFPALDHSGKIFLRERGRVFSNPSGHGGTFLALKDSGALSWLDELGVEEIFYCQVDNVLVKVLDPAFIGYHVTARSDMSSKCVMKNDPMEKVGVFVLENGRTVVVEYTELEQLEGQRQGPGLESLRAGSIAIHMINARFARQLVSGGQKLPLHRAHKVVPHVGPNGGMIKPERPNGYKIETFIFDALRYARNSVVMEVRREEEFSPLKNRSGKASPSTVENDQIQFYTRWLEEAGIEVPKDTDGASIHKIEISPLFASIKEDFLEKVPKMLSIDGDTYIE
jgi:UDP-N-acetylglucosamine/UDP-N-acetylgalactosamine diphosphorylase